MNGPSDSPESKPAQTNAVCPDCQAPTPAGAESCFQCGCNLIERDEADVFSAEAAGERMSLAAEFWDFLKHNKKWWLAPIIVVILGVGILVWLSSTAAAPFIYPLF